MFVFHMYLLHPNFTPVVNTCTYVNIARTTLRDHSLVKLSHAMLLKQMFCSWCVITLIKVLSTLIELPITLIRFPHYAHEVAPCCPLRLLGWPITLIRLPGFAPLRLLGLSLAEVIFRWVFGLSAITGIRYIFANH